MDDYYLSCQLWRLFPCSGHSHCPSRSFVTAIRLPWVLSPLPARLGRLGGRGLFQTLDLSDCLIEMLPDRVGQCRLLSAPLLVFNTMRFRASSSSLSRL